MTSDMPLAELDRRQLGTDSQSDELDGSDELYQQLAGRVPEVWPVLMLIAKAAEQRGWSLYIVGGAVRDLLLGMLGDTRPLTDIDLVVEGCQTESATTIEGAGVVLAEAIRTEYTQVEVQVHGQFQTAVLTWQSWQIDIATARTEYYPYPAANPEVESSDIRRDLYRRDFTVNAIALRLTDQLMGQLTGTSPGQLIDLFGGWSDLRQCLVRVLHENSFIDDPTRIFRGVRFAVRLGFDLEAQTEQLIRTAVNSGVYDKSRTQHEKVPALQSRLRAELKYLFEEAGWEKSLVQLGNLGALVCIDSQLAITSDLLRQLRRMDRWLRKFDAGQPRWLLLLELLLAQLEVDRASQSAQTLNLGSQSQYRLRHIHAWESHLEVHLGFRLGKLSGQSQLVIRPSQVFELLRSHSRAELLLMAARHPRTIGPFIWQYITRLADVPTLINGATLKRLGYPPGPRFKEILTDIHRQQLDGKLATADSAEQYVLTYHPQ
ncbi:MAG: CCA tRNA nucleotidyltransferase [Cyanobacteria bacterium P01_D01_bin.1]